MMNVGEATCPRTPSLEPIPWVSVVLPAPRSPVRTTRSPARSRPASRLPSSRVVCGSGSCQVRSEEHTSELQSRGHLVCRLLLEKKKNTEEQPRVQYDL